ncbi:MAG: PA14 domain-containing protein, partial [Polyangiaceae bacterium]|nr:PA14 domain-containing protein [Polyangiaceae bacterium]
MVSKFGGARLGGFTSLCAGAFLLVSPAAWAAPVLSVPASAKLSEPRAGVGEGFCARFVKSSSDLNTIASALNLLDGLTGAPDEPANGGAGISNFLVLAPMADFHDAQNSVTGWQAPYNNLFPWTSATLAGATRACTSHQPASGGTYVADYFAMRLRGEINVTSAGIKTFATRTDDGYRLSVGGLQAVQYDTPRSTYVDTARVSFAEPGVYAIEYVYYEQAGKAVFEAFFADQEITFTNGAIASPAGSGSDLVSSSMSPLPSAFELLSSGRVWRESADAECAALVGQPNDRCVLSPASAAITCGNGTIDRLAGGAVEACDDGNKVSGDGCEADCSVTAAYLCTTSQPSVCS